MYPYVPVRVHICTHMCQCTICASAQYVPVHIGTLLHRLAAEPRSTAGLLFTLSVSLWNDLANPVFDGVGLAGFKSRANAFLWALAALSLL